VIKIETMGNLNSGRHGGNPDLKIYQFKSEREESLTERVTLRLTPSMMQYLKQLDNYPEFIRQAILEKIQREARGETPHQQPD